MENISYIKVIQASDLERIFFTGGHHFYHAKIIEYCNRPFSGVPEMNKTLIDNWNKRIDSSCIVYHLGDFGFTLRPILKELIHELNGYKIIVRGNHDRRGVESLKSIGWDEAYKHFVELDVSYDDQEVTLLLTHRPVKVLIDTKPVVNICGHVHDNWLVRGFSINVDVDVHGFHPISLGEITTMIPELKEGIMV